MGLQDRILDAASRVSPHRLARDVAGQSQVIAEHGRVLELLEGRLKAAEAYGRLFNHHGSLISSAHTSPAFRNDVRHYYAMRERSEIALTIAQIWRGGDYWEFGASPLNTFCNILTAFHINEFHGVYPDTRFYAFDLFGKGASSEEQEELVEANPDYFATYIARGDELHLHQAHLENHGLFVDQCELVQGFFQDTLTKERKEAYLAEGRKIGCAFLDCNIMPSYKTVFEFIDGMLQPFSFIYMDEFYWPQTYLYWEQFKERLREEHGLGVAYLRNAASFGALFSVHPLATDAPPLSFS
tara:strand:- start:2319 stop:3212 length:894 start_codon:yes stop_codon:yes gene_type:complete